MRKDLTGKKFGRLTVLSLSASKGKARQSYWNCRCSCGQEKVVRGTHLGKITSCGCYGKTAIGLRSRTHGKCQTKEYRVWAGMIARCEDKNNHKYPIYGGRGIKVCEEWRKSFEAFLKDLGLRPSPAYSIDRKDSDKGYEPSNCRWATSREQNQNRRDNVNLSFQGETLCVTEWARRLGINQSTLQKRLKRWPVEKALGSRRMR